ncbi:glycoside hydrolase family 16 protein [Nocardioides agariphilus]|jgi:beta-glucanase (GH16 family)|uniref:Glycoside hydrolase family 16 protein n=1 Tax=Nocardioides agariphilus TaxID=433664 RepID=A0A930YR80_9ACTN|nr:glycoside hydrolase family 16 protein [Nocardioides agariphilus]MBF4770130.1 glycoside hydrolase family 16 protein [Nocardioides agariphilus]
MPLLRAVGAGALSLLLPASALLVAGSDPAVAKAPATSTSVSARLEQTIRLMSLPQIVQPGGRVANPDTARAAFTATIRPITAGRKVKLQVLKGSSWQTVATVGQNRKGRAQFAAAATSNGQPLTYRAVAASYPDLPAITSRSVSTERWLSPTWTDRFSGTSLSAKWQQRGQTYEPQSSRNCSRGSAKAVKVGGGVVRLSVMRDPNRHTLCPALKAGQVAGHYAYRLNGHIGTDDRFSFKYGVAAARMKFPRLPGQHGSFWMQPVGGMYPGGTGHEIDVIESFGTSRRSSGLWTYIWRYQSGSIVKSGVNIPNTFLSGRRDAWWKRFHVFSVQWKPHLLVFRIDGKETWRIGGKVSQVQQYVILSLLSSDYEIPLIQDSQLPQHMYVDWVRVWETGG